jgi:hypothetical protein
MGKEVGTHGDEVCVCGNGTLLCVKTRSVAIFLPHLQAYKLPNGGKYELNLICKYY